MSNVKVQAGYKWKRLFVIQNQAVTEIMSILGNFALHGFPPVPMPCGNAGKLYVARWMLKTVLLYKKKN